MQVVCPSCLGFGQVSTERCASNSEDDRAGSCEIRTPCTTCHGLSWLPRVTTLS
jgi:DnaJ-class molecular chaperone